VSAAERFDVAVIGGGSAGVAAAVAAAHAGARTLLAERSDVLGGNAAQAFVHTICGLYLAADAGDAVPAHAGFPARFAAGLAQRGGAGRPERAGRVWFLPTDPPRLAAYARELCERAPRVELRLRAALRACTPADAGEGFALGFEGAAAAEARLVVDASGDAAAAALAGAGVEASPPDELQSPSYIVRIEGVDTRALEPYARLRAGFAVAAAVRAKTLPPGCESVLVRPLGAPRAAGEAFLQVNVPKPEGVPYDPLDDVQRAALVGVAAWPRRLGVRESRRARGELALTREDVLAGRRRDDEVALSTWPIELWRDHRRAHFEHPAGPCSVPLGALVCRGAGRLGVAGRCLSATHEALGALRVIGTALATGEAIGTTAALAADAGSALGDVAPARVRAHILAVASEAGGAA
jgi:FAD dependent oxidoreductase